MSQNLSELRGDYFLIKCPVMDFTDPQHAAHIDILSGDKELRLDLNRRELPRIISFLRRSIFSRDFKPGRVICWDIKNLFSYLRHYTDQEFFLEETWETTTSGKSIKKTPLILDLKVLERYCGINSQVPESYIEAVRRLRKIDIQALKRVYNKLHMTLIREVIPSLENVALVSNEARVYANYEIEGQTNGRCNTDSVC